MLRQMTSIRRNILATISILLFSCSSKGSNDPPFIERYIVDFTSDDAVDVTAIFPSDAGNTWTYEDVLYADYQDTTPTDTILKYRCEVRVIGRTTFLGFNDVIELREHAVVTYSIFGSDIGDAYDGSTFYQNKSDGLYEIAYYNPAVPFVNPKSAHSKVDFSGAYFTPLYRTGHDYKAADDTVLRNKLVLKYPLKKGKKWTAFDDPWTQRIEIGAKGSVVVPAGSMPVFLMKHFNYNEGITDYTFNTYIGDVGLVAREIINYDIEFADDAHPAGGIFYDLIEKSELINYTFNPH